MLEVRNLSKNFREFALKDISFTVEEGDYFILLGESGAGKSVILETIAGLVVPDSGKIFLKGKDITSESIQKRRIGLVFQDHAIFPHMTAENNIGYSLQNRGFSAQQRKEMICRVAEDLEISHLLHRKPASLSGGELQRVGLARTLVQDPEILLLDEPLSSLDTRLKADIRNLLHRIHRSGRTIVHVTHDYEEALALGNRIAVINEGRIVQQGDPEEVFSRPANAFVAHFTGLRNFFRATALTGPDGNFSIVGDKLLIRIGEPREGDGYILIRDEDIFLSQDKIFSSAANNFEGVIERITATARGMDITVRSGIAFHALITRESVKDLDLTEGKKVWIHFKATAVRFIS